MTQTTSIRKRLNWYVVVTTLVMLTVIGITVYITTAGEADEIFDARMVVTARSLEDFINKESITAHHQRLANKPALPEMSPADETHENESQLFFVIRDHQGNTLLSPAHAPDLSSIKNQPGYSRLRIDDEEWITYTRKSNQDGLWIIVAETAAIRREINEHLGSSLLIPLVFLLPLILFFLWKTVSIALAPLRSAVDQVNRQDVNHLREIEVAGIPAEIEPLVTAFNQMLLKLNSALAREKRFVSDASHELRNPLAALLINVDNAIEENHDPELTESLASMKLSISRLSHLVAQLLELSHSENPLASQDLEQLDLAELCRQQTESRKSVAATRHQTIKLVLPPNECHVKGVAPLLESLVSNLLDNAIKYCPEGCDIRLKLESRNQQLIMSVDDSGEGLDPEQRSKVLERFYRASGTSSTGAGLGLSIVKTIADIHAATMDLKRSDLGGLSVRISFPAANNSLTHVPQYALR